MRKLALFMAIVISIGTTSTVLAKDVDHDTNKSELYLKYVDHGVYTPVDNTLGIKTADDIEIVKVTATEDKELYHINGDKYVSFVDPETYLLLNKVDLDPENVDYSKEVFEQYKISDKLEESINKMIEKQKSVGNDKFEISIYVPAVNASVDSRTVSTTTSYYSKGDRNFRDTIVKYTNSSTGMIEKKGTDVKTVANSFVSFILSATGVTSKTVSAFGVGQSALDVFETIYGPVAYGSNDDQLYTLVLYDKLEKQTDMQFGSTWYDVGLISYRVALTRNDTYQLYAATGNSFLKKYDLNTTYYSEHFQDAADTVIKNFPTAVFDGAIRIKIHSTNVVL